jgi:Toprim domain-containing protein/CHC2-type zinc finger protein
MELRFRDVAALKAEEAARPKGVFEAALLPDEEKERLCRTLLAEFGVTSVKVGGDGEMIHCCSLPYHDENNASASLNYQKLTYNCFGCQSSGGLLWYIATCRGESGEGAQRWLEDQTGTGPDEQPLSSLLSFFEATYGPRADRRTPIPKMSRRVLEPWLAIHPYMTDPPPDGRGIPEETLMRFLVGYNTFNINLGSEEAPRWVKSPRIVIPHIWKDNLVGWQSRRLYDDGTPKYQSTGDFPKDQTIYNFDERSSSVVVVESPMSVLSKAHLPEHIEATFGASVTDRQVRLLSIHRRVILFMDNDEAGWNATESLADSLSDYSEVFVVDSPWAADPADMDDWTYFGLIESAVPYSLWTRPKTLQPWERVPA